MTGLEVKRGQVDKGYRGHNHLHKFRRWISRRVRRTTAIKREMKRRAANEPVTGHVKAEHGMVRNYVRRRSYKFSLLLRCLAELWRVLLLLMTSTCPFTVVV